MPSVVHFEIPADDPEKVIEFYRKAFGWKITKWAGPADYWIAITGNENEPGINGAIMKRMNKGATTRTVIDVPSVDEYVKKITSAGGKLIMPKRAIPKAGYVAYCSDNDGNVFGIMEKNSNAK